MSNRLTKGKALAGRFAQDGPGFEFQGVNVTTVASTTDRTTGYSFSKYDILTDIYVRVTSASTASTGFINVGLLTDYTSGFVAALPITSTGTQFMFAVSSSGSSPYWFYSANYYGWLFGKVLTGTTEGSTGYAADSGGRRVMKPYALDSTTNRTLSYSANTTTAFSATIFPVFYTLTT